MFPCPLRLHEGFVIETSRKEARDFVVDGTDVEFQAGPVVLRSGGQAVENLGRGGALVGLETVALPHVHKRVWFFCTAGHDAARAVVFEGTSDQGLAVCQQGGGQSVAFVAL